MSLQVRLQILFVFNVFVHEHGKYYFEYIYDVDLNNLPHVPLFPICCCDGYEMACKIPNCASQ